MPIAFKANCVLRNDISFGMRVGRPGALPTFGGRRPKSTDEMRPRWPRNHFPPLKRPIYRYRSAALGTPLPTAAFPEQPAFARGPLRTNTVLRKSAAFRRKRRPIPSTGALTRVSTRNGVRHFQALTMCVYCCSPTVAYRVSPPLYPIASASYFYLILSARRGAKKTANQGCK